MTPEAFGMFSIELVCRSTLILAAAAGLYGLMRRSPASHRHAVLLCALAGLLILPLLMQLPAWELPLLPGPEEAPALAPEPAPTGVSPEAEGSVISLAEPVEPLPAPAPGIAWPLWLWGLGAAALLVRWTWRLVMLALYSRRCRPIYALPLLELVDGLCWQMGIRTIVRCVESEPDAGAPMTWGWRSPVVALPPGGERWPAERLRGVLLHELAHVERRDWLWQQVASVVCALYWFHPGVWWAAARLRTESEAACDDRVLEAGMPAPDYARSLLEVVQTMQGKQTLPALTMARGSRLERRILSILARRRRGMLTPGAALAAAGLTALVVLPIAATRVTARPADVAPGVLAPPAPGAPEAPRPPAAPPAPPEPPAPKVEVRPAPPDDAPPTPRERRLRDLERRARELARPRSESREPVLEHALDRAALEARVREQIARAQEELKRLRSQLERERPDGERGLGPFPGLNDPEIRKRLEEAREQIRRRLDDPALRRQFEKAGEELHRAFSREEFWKHFDDSNSFRFSEEVSKNLEAARRQLERALARRDEALRNAPLKRREQTELNPLEQERKQLRELYERSAAEAEAERRRAERLSESARLEAQVRALRERQAELQRQIDMLERELRARKK